MEKPNFQFEVVLKKIKSIFMPVNYSKGGIKPDRDWQMILVFFTIFFVALVVFSVSIYMSVSSGSFWRDEKANRTIKKYNINSKNLEIVTEYFQGKKENFKNGPGVIGDPSN